MSMTCECSEEYGPCENHSELIVQREGASLRSADMLCEQLVDDAVDLGAEISPWGKDVMQRVRKALADPMTSWIADEALADELHSLRDQMETELATLDYEVYWDDGYRIVLAHEDCPLNSV